MLKKSLRTVFCVICLIGLLSVGVSASVMIPYLGYEYNTEDESVPAPVGYEPVSFFLGGDIGCGALISPTDFCFSGDELFILDSGNSRIVVTDENLNLKRVIGQINKNGELLDYTGAGGLYVCAGGNILIADTAGQRILECDRSGNWVQSFLKPDTPMLSENLVYSVKKVIRDANGITYALVDGVNDGAITYMNDGSFGGFFAMNEVEKTAQVILNYIWKHFMTEEQIKNSATASPSSITNFDLAEKGFVYTVTQTSEGESSVRLLNFKGSNLESETAFGDLEWDRKIKDSVATTFCDIDVDAEKYIYLLDSARNRVFVYSQDGLLVTVFGGAGEQLGTFTSPAAVESHNDCVYVLDDQQGSITVFRANEYLKTVKTAMNLLDAGRYSESRAYWDKVLTLNSNSTIAYYGIGLALDESGSYREALHYFKMANANKQYSEAFKEVRREFVKQNFVWILAGAAVLIAGIVVSARVLKRKFGRENAYAASALEGKYTAPLFTVLHPVDGYERLKREKKWSAALCFGILAGLFFTLTAKWFLTGFSFNTNRASDYSFFITLLKAFAIVGVCAVANWAVCTLIEGKGRLSDILGMLIYSLVPYIIAQLLVILFSNLLTQEEAAFLTALEVLGIIWSAALIFVGFMTIHQFSFSKNILSILLTVVGIAIIIFLAILFVGLLQQVISFFKSIGSEAVMIL